MSAGAGTGLMELGGQGLRSGEATSEKNGSGWEMIIRSYCGLEAGESFDKNSILGKASCQLPIGQAAAEVEK